jgi:hypothetical protein
MMRPTPGRLLVVLFVAASVAAVAAGLAIIGPPWVQREMAIDQRRAEDLNALRWEIEARWQTQDRLPTTLDELGPEWAAMTVDPETGAAYEYETTGARSYRLCATFAHPTDTPDDPRWMGDFEVHSAGRHCFDLEVPAE